MDYTSRNVTEEIQQIWTYMDSVCPAQAWDSGDVRHIGISIQRPKDTEESISDLCFLLMQVFQDAADSDADARVFETESGLQIVTGHFQWARRLVGILMSWNVALDADDVNPVRSDALSHAREIRVGCSEWN